MDVDVADDSIAVVGAGNVAGDVDVDSGHIGAADDHLAESRTVDRARQPTVLSSKNEEHVDVDVDKGAAVEERAHVYVEEQEQVQEQVPIHPVGPKHRQKKPGPPDRQAL